MYGNLADIAGSPREGKRSRSKRSQRTYHARCTPAAEKFFKEKGILK